jgi:oligopeptide/dipeptide ABC transporter ATP-binding protein
MALTTTMTDEMLVLSGAGPAVAPVSAAPSVARDTTADLLEVSDLAVEFSDRGSSVRAVQGLELRIARGQVVGLVGESGCGKTTAAMAIAGLLPGTARITRGSIRLDGEELVGLDDRAMRRVRGVRIGVIFQDPLSYLNPVLTIGRQVTEALEAHGIARGGAARARGIELLGLVGLPEPERRFGMYPHQLSGGQRQRAMIAMALSCGPQLLVADEPTTALDVTVQAQILALLDRLRTEYGMAILLITHNLGVVAGITDHVAVMYAGRVVEMGATAKVLGRPHHPYTHALLRAVPRIDRRRAGGTAIEGSPPDLRVAIPGCAFEPRCQARLDRCATEAPPSSPTPDLTEVACWNPMGRAG